jgi:hypothetical protein
LTLRSRLLGGETRGGSLLSSSGLCGLYRRGTLCSRSLRGGLPLGSSLLRCGRARGSGLRGLGLRRGSLARASRNECWRS